MIGSHVTPIDHQYYVSYDFEKGNEADVDIDVYSPGDGVVTQIQHMNVAAGDDPIAIDDFRLVINRYMETADPKTNEGIDDDLENGFIANGNQRFGQYFREWIE